LAWATSMKILIGIVIGYVLGVASVFFYQVFGKPALPTEPEVMFAKLTAEDGTFGDFLIESEYGRMLSEEYDKQQKGE